MCACSALTLAVLGTLLLLVVLVVGVAAAELEHELRAPAILPVESRDHQKEQKYVTNVRNV